MPNLTVFINFIEKLWAWRFLGPCFIFSSMLLVLDYSPYFRDKINTMNISNWIFGFWLFCLACIVCKGCAWAGGRIEQKATQRKKEKFLQSLLMGLLPEEVATLRYILNRPASVVWLPYNNNAALGLRHKGCLEYAWGVTEYRGKVYVDAEQCVACSIPGSIRDYIETHSSELETHWGPSRICDEFDVYQG